MELGTAEHPGGVVDCRVHWIALVRKNTVEALYIGQFGDLVADEIIQPDTGDAAVDLVVDPGVAAVVVAVLVRGVGVVGVGDGVAQAAVGLGAHDLLGFVGDAPAHQRVGHEAGDAQQLATRGQAQHAHVSGVSTAPQAVVGVELAGLEVHVGTGVCCRLHGGRCWRCGWLGRRLVVVAAHRACRESGQRGGVDEPAAAHADGGVAQICVFLAHIDLSEDCWKKRGA
ncbi:hypothetical protein SDC9_80867 [bioreactor metagenome]|uniref:Uncharacterized protein n=1 Tax=bioreactor metagenome TaxID=1076179 RepID=A0A644Z071_9ZZZZ